MADDLLTRCVRAGLNARVSSDPTAQAKAILSIIEAELREPSDEMLTAYRDVFLEHFHIFEAKPKFMRATAWLADHLAEVRKGKSMTQTVDDIVAEEKAACREHEMSPLAWRMLDRLAERLKPMIEAQVQFKRGYYDEAVKGWVKLREARAKIHQQAAEIGRLKEALDRVMIGGNSLAIHHRDDWPIPLTEPLIALEIMGSGIEFDIWCCWREIMLARTELTPPNGEG